MSKGSAGRFVWYDLMTTDPKGAAAFYGEVVGWKTEPYGGDGYTMWVGSQGPLGGTMLLPEEAKAMGAPPHWLGYVSVDDVDAAVARARERGGRVYLPGKDIPEIGRFAILADPHGAAFAVFTPTREMPPHDPNTPGEFCWAELSTPDLEASTAFYADLVGWQKAYDHDMGEMGPYRIYGVDGAQLGGMFTPPKSMPMPPAFLLYVETDDLDAAVARAQRLGGSLINGPMEVPGGARIAQLVDPQGAAFALHARAKA